MKRFHDVDVRVVPKYVHDYQFQILERQPWDLSLGHFALCHTSEVHTVRLNDIGLDCEGMSLRMRVGVCPTGGGDDHDEPILFHTDPSVVNVAANKLRILRVAIADAHKLITSSRAADRKKGRRMLKEMGR